MPTPQKLVSELKGLAADTEQLIEEVADQSGERIAAARDKARAAVSLARARLADLAEAGAARARATGEATDEYVHDNPWRVIAAVAVLGLVAGAMLSGRR